jgi:short subunit dehydrogenase-like uncharacterized protein
VVSELRSRGWTAVLSGRDSARLNAAASAELGLETRPASVDDPRSLDRALLGSAAVINCAGPFVDTSGPVIEAALRARIAYLDVTAELEVAAFEFEQYGNRARGAGIVIVPAMAFFGGLGDLLATSAMGDWEEADEIGIAYALDSWKPTLGTRATGRVSKQRRAGARIVFSNHRMELRREAPPIVEWSFPAPFGKQVVQAEYTTADILTISRHLRASEIRTYMTLAPLEDLSDPDVPAPVAADESGRSSQVFLVEALARSGGAKRRAVAAGRDIYAISAPLVVEAARRVLSRPFESTGVFSPGEIFDAPDFLRSLSPNHLTVEIP